MVSSGIRVVYYFWNENSQIYEPLRYCSEQTIFFLKINYNINKIYYVHVYFNLILYKRIDYNYLNVLFSIDILKTKKHQVSRCAHILLIEHPQCKQHVTFIHKKYYYYKLFARPGKVFRRTVFYFCEKLY
jgi:hypothetical protein